MTSASSLTSAKTRAHIQGEPCQSGWGPTGLEDDHHLRGGDSEGRRVSYAICGRNSFRPPAGVVRRQTIGLPPLHLSIKKHPSASSSLWVGGRLGSSVRQWVGPLRSQHHLETQRLTAADVLLSMAASSGPSFNEAKKYRAFNF